MNTSKTARELFAEMDALKAELAKNYCQCCGRPLTIIVQPALRAHLNDMRYGTCYNEECRRYTITREINDLYALTEAQVEEFNQATNERRRVEAAEG